MFQGAITNMFSWIYIGSTPISTTTMNLNEFSSSFLLFFPQCLNNLVMIKADSRIQT